MEVGFLGLGIMGRAMTVNLLKNRVKVTVWNRTLSKCDELVEYGASIAETPAAVVKKCNITIGMLSDPPAALSVVFGKDGVLEAIGKGKSYIDMSTVDAETSTKISEAITSKGGHFLEAPVSGSKQPAETGQLVILAAGEKALYEEAIPAFDILGKRSFYLGQVGNGAKMKLVVNMIMGSMMNAFSEGLVLAERSGLDPHSLLDVLDLGAIANPMFRGKGPSMIKSNHPPAFPLKHQQKDMRLALALGDENAVSMPVAAAANEYEGDSRKHIQHSTSFWHDASGKAFTMRTITSTTYTPSASAFKKARALGLGDLDFSAVYETVKHSKPSS